MVMIKIVCNDDDKDCLLCNEMTIKIVPVLMIRLVSIHGNDKDCLQCAQTLSALAVIKFVHTVITIKSVCTVVTIITSVCLDIEDCFCRCLRVRTSTIPYKCKQSYIMP